MMFTLSAEMAEIARNHQHAKQKPWPVRLSPAHLASELHAPQTAEDAETLVDRIERLRVGAIAIDTEYRFTTEAVQLKGRKVWQDVSALQPLILSAAVWVTGSSEIIRVFFDLRNPELLNAVKRFLRLRVLFVAHNIKAEFQCLWSLGLAPLLHQTWDTYVAARALELGSGKSWNAKKVQAKESEDWSEMEQLEVEQISRLSLLGQCRAYGVVHPFAAAKDTLQTSFLTHPTGAPFASDQINYAVADAVATLQVYLAQYPVVADEGLTTSLLTVEFPFAEANARMEFDGVPVDRQRLAKLHTALTNAVDHLGAQLRGYGIENPGSSVQVLDYLRHVGLESKLKVKGKLSTEDSVLEAIEQLDPAVPLIRRYRRYRSHLSSPLFHPDLIGADGRYHPNHRHLGADTGRNTCSGPNIVGLSKTFRPVVAAQPNRAIVEADFAQIEVGIAAAEFGDPDLIDAYNSGDVYAAVAMRFYNDILTDEERGLTVWEFKGRRKDLRDKIKTFVLAIIYGMGDQSIADRFGVALNDARKQREDFMGRFPGIRASMERAVTNHKVSGYAPIIGGLRRAILKGRKADNQSINTPIQGSAGVVFRKAVVDLYREFRMTSTKLILPVHDAIVIECECDQVEIVAEKVRRIMESAVRTYYPELKPRVDINLEDTSCWNKDGHGDSIDRFLENPDFKV